MTNSEQAIQIEKLKKEISNVKFRLTFLSVLFVIASIVTAYSIFLILPEIQYLKEAIAKMQLTASD